MTDKTTTRSALAGFTMAAHAIYLLALLVVCVSVGGLVIYWLMGTPFILHMEPSIIFRFVAFQIVLFGVVALGARVFAIRLSKHIEN